MRSMKKIAFVEADKFILAEDYRDVAPFKPHKTIITSYGAFYADGTYKVSKGFLFSANSPAINTLDSRRGAMIHDFFYCLMKDAHLSREYRYDVDYYFYNILLEDGMIPLRALAWFKAVRIGGDNALDAPSPKVQYAPANPMQPAGWQLKDMF